MTKRTKNVQNMHAQLPTEHMYAHIHTGTYTHTHISTYTHTHTYIHTHKGFLAMKKNEAILFAGKWIQLEITI